MGNKLDLIKQLNNKLGDEVEIKKPKSTLLLESILKKLEENDSSNVDELRKLIDKVNFDTSEVELKEIKDLMSQSLENEVEITNRIHLHDVDGIELQKVKISNFPEQKEFPKEISIDNQRKHIEVTNLDQIKIPDKITVDNFPEQKEFPKTIEVSNLSEFPKEIKISNLPKQKDFPKEIAIKKPKWFKQFDIKEPLNDLVEFFIELSKKVFKVDAEKHQKAENAIAMRLVDSKGNFIDKITSNVNIQQPLGGGGPPPPTKLGNVDGDTINPAILENQLSQLITRVATYSADANIVYTGSARIGSEPSDAAWKIIRYDESMSDIAKTVDTGNFTQVWDNREALTYN